MRHATILSLLAVFPSLASAQHFTQPDRIAKVSAPVSMDTTGMFQAAFASVGDDIFIGGQPTERALREMKARGVTTVVNLRTPEEMEKAVKFDEPALVRQLGMKYVYIPMRGTAEFPYSPAAVTTFTDAVKNANGKVLLHCTVGWRASHLWAAYLIQERGLSEVDALANARAINLMDNHRMGVGQKQPVEEMLGHALPTIGHPSPDEKQ
jgi:uncharacterized protein (TIGR01244 family)